MNLVTVKIVSKTYKLKFGYGVLRRLSEHYNVATFEDLGDYIDGLKLSEGKLSFDGLNFISQLIIAAIEYQEDTYLGLNPDIIIDEVVFKDQDKVAEIITAFFNSFPKANEGKAGKPKPTQKKGTGKK